MIPFATLKSTHFLRDALNQLRKCNLICFYGLHELDTAMNAREAMGARVCMH